ncbi:MULTISPECIES: UDP-N-acetylmuramoyl-L-alanyl-D-glutamate--2,6-diaminopimelate ligase [unclassified Campylobacter]|uniref:UDP-N-acetylmuramoyl-L-alanyl-D-glutamate--2, 6-diaminopimelate ligase n=1 Tax=unclassified Campylobacter TaxID=2593542 RepID=UPI0022E99FC0|nr:MULTISPECIES: UDP-N-acetylmuramoyl-L-alanyl-D-glutamate--2,6-diaminopimelate ligase [unclassified Campylobacter]MDA3043053.1 UDP-N-acetylmuramoyl-L-alanyl-D-glutamate--2,6-diaminopimelate ligase [Campylobacter sp. JMF_09 ED2]MDA3044909.1 UDP-N-acetylmuramoyl-L-alanyl-D-glutamate--2,6-diaminopimelate ligase [Campylobacter sp. JMF_07 ED4]MDA3063945.1 UDP-N-acetylmuramoyl-L-alanyl-D-glutamate--2,6-diaminopimelate ligase [Campylobacter sp. JMF_11 EL3]MDA3072271.1 UDP-N-acetylmuramoyl-L-alanyl-D-
MKIGIKNSFITDNSGECESGCYFVQTSANAKFSAQAEQNGAQIISISEAKALLGIDESIKIVGITGTNGKTTTAALIYSMLLDLGYSVGLCGTRGAFINDKRIDEKGLTTSSVFKTMSYLLEATKQKCEFFVMEVSSHAIAQNRIEGLNFALKIFTNLSQDHLDYHKTMSEYAAVKSSFFADESAKLINKDDGHIEFNLKNALTYGVKNPATFSVLAYSVKGAIDAMIKTPNGEFEISSELIGEFNLYNALAAFGAVKMLTNKNEKDIAKAMSNFAGVEGRVQVVAKNPLVIVDFAHTPDGIEKVLNALKDNELIVVFGAGGDRDPLKRPLMGAMVEHFAKFAIITSDNPRSEDPEKIIAQIEEGMRDKEKITKIADRKEAIKKAINLAQNGEVVVILGKGDETYQEIKGVKYPFSDKDVVLEILKEQK